MRKTQILFAIICCLITISSYAQTTSLSGKVTDSVTNEPVMFASVALYLEGALWSGAEADLDGNYHFNDLNPGIYDIKVSFIGYQPLQIEDVIVYEGQHNIVDLSITEGVVMDEIEVIGYREPLIKRDNTTQGSTVTSEEIKNLPTRSINGLAKTSAGVGSSDGRDLNIRGGRSKATTYYIDGVAVKGNLIPDSKTIKKAERKGRKLNKKAHKEKKSTPEILPIPSTEDYDYIAENGFLSTKNEPLSTFSIDVDRASYSNLRRFINNNQMPPLDAVRVEEMVNYFHYDYEQPRDKDPFSITTEYTTCPWNKKNTLLHIGIQGKDVDLKDIPDANLVFLVDVSGSMHSDNKLPLVKESLKMLVRKLRPSDRIALVTYAGSTRMVLPSTPVSKVPAILAAIDALGAGGSTAGASGIKLAYETARKFFIKNGNNRVLLATDGDFNVGVSSDSELQRIIEKEREDGVFLSVLGYGTGNYKDNKMQILADKGNGNHAYIDNIKEAEKVLIEEMASTLYTIAKDVKIQIEFNPAEVAEYRLVGYENRLLANEDFNDDKKDAGELGAGHTVTAIYEIKTKARKQKKNKAVDALKYQTDHNSSPNFKGELATIKLRYKKPDGNKSKLITETISNETRKLEETSDNLRWAASIAQFGLTIRNSKYVKKKDYPSIIANAEAAMGVDKNGDRAEAMQLMQRMQEIDEPSLSSK